MSIFYFDTSVLLPVLVSAHPRHGKCLSALELAMKKGRAFTASHACAELYSNLTILPHGLSIPPEKAAEAIIKNLAEVLHIIDLTRNDYQAATKAKADVLYTANLRDFGRLMTQNITFDLKDVG